MSYCTIEDLKSTGVTETKLIQLTNDGKAETVNTDVLDNAIKAADSMIDGYLATRYAGAMPLTTVPQQITTISTQLTKYFLYQLKDAVTDKLQKVYDNQVALLKQIANGTFRLTELETSTPVRQDGVTFTNKSMSDRVFTTSLEGYFE
jgi:phage gp36-like protein